MGNYKLRPYQKEAVKTINNLKDGSRSVCVLATGLGKTLVASQVDCDGRMLWLSHRDELVRQPEKYFADRGWSYGIEKAGEVSNGEKVVSASIQSLSRDSRLEQFDPHEFDMIVVDEAHHSAAPSYRKVLDYFKPKKLLGLTATPQRGDNVRLTDVFDDICFSRDLKWGIENKYLARLRCTRVSASFDMKNAKKSLGDFTVSSLDTIMDKSDNARVVAQAYKELCHKQKRQTLVYCPTVKVCDDVCAEIGKLFPDGNPSVVLSDRNTAEERKNILDRYNSGDIQCIVNCMILTEGTDLVTTSAIICDRPSANPTLYQQIIGRGTRLHPKKKYCLIIDIVGKHSRERRICTAPTLLGLDPNILNDDIIDQLSDGDLLDNINAIIEEDKNNQTKFKLVCELYDLFTNERVNLIDKNRGKEDMMNRIASDYDSTFLSSNSEYDFGNLVVTRTPDNSRYYKIKATYNGSIFFSKPDMLDKTKVTFEIPMFSDELPSVRCTSMPMEMDKAIAMVSDILTYAVPPKFAFLWSRKEREAFRNEPATDRQIEYIGKLYNYRFSKTGKDRNLNKLEASDLIEMANEIDEYRRKSYFMRQEAEKIKGKGKNATPAQTGMSKSQVKEYQDNYVKQMPAVWAIVEREKKKRSKLRENRIISLQNPDALSLKARYPATANQLSFVASLFNNCQRYGVVFDISEEQFSKMVQNKRNASICIDLLIQLKQVAGSLSNMGSSISCNMLTLYKALIIPGFSPQMPDCYIMYIVN